MSRIAVFPDLSAAGYSRHCLHGPDVVWLEKNCYGDLWIELLHALKLEPRAILAFTLAVDFEGDQWTFFKPSQEELRDLYGIDVQELTVWRPLVEHAVEHLSAGKLISTEADAFWLPDTVGTDYRVKHTKTTILLANIDVQARQLGYFHNAGYFELSGEDFVELFRLDKPEDPTFLPLFAELVKIDRIVTKTPAELANDSWRLLQRHLSRRPAANPFHRFGDRFAKDLPELQAAGLAHYHAWAFASIRQAGAAFDLASAYLNWLSSLGYPKLAQAALKFDAIAQANKALILKGARAVNSKRAIDTSSMFSGMAQAWEEGMNLLSQGC